MSPRKGVFFLIDCSADPYATFTGPLFWYLYNKRIDTDAFTLAKERGSDEVKLLFENYSRKNSDLFGLLFNALSL